MSQFFYDNQIRRFLLQIIAVFSNFNVEYGPDSSGNKALLRVPAMYGDPSRMAANIIKDNSENKTLSSPAISIYITDLVYRREDVQNPGFVDKLQIRERKINHTDNTYSMHQGNALTVERMMPVPYSLKIKLDIWTSNTEQKLQLLEQILPLFNPELEIQSSDKFIDWTSLSMIYLDDVSWSSRSIPVGTDDQIDVATLSFNIPIWLSLPVKVKKLGVIQTIIASIYDANGEMSEDLMDNINLMKNRVVVTPMGYDLILINGAAALIPGNGPVDRGSDSTDLPTNNNKPIAWGPLINNYGQLKNGISKLKLIKDYPDNITEVVGTVTLNDADPYTLLFNVDVDTIPQNTLPPVTAIISPGKSRPGKGLPAAEAGQRYLIVGDINGGTVTDSTFDGADAWKSTSGIDFYAHANDIITYDGNSWQISWNSKTSPAIEYVTNLKTGVQYKWNKSEWVKSYEGEYPASTWRLVI